MSVKPLFQVVLFFLGTSVIVCSCSDEKRNKFQENTDQHKDPDLAPFYHGVASGDPDQHSVVIWTRMTPLDSTAQVQVSWQMSRSDDFREDLLSGSMMTSSERDFTCKAVVEGLQPGSHYFYRFIANGDTSLVGRTKTAASDANTLRFAVASCSNYEWGYFNAYQAIANESDLDAVIHLGDYIYEYGIGYYGDTTIGRLNIPATEILSLQDYRDRYALYRLDPDLREAHQYHPFIAIWDDHEITNNAYGEGAQNHQADEGSYADRRAIARRVYYEWMPIREQQKHYRDFSFGNLVDLIMLDERLEGRSQPADSLTDPSYLDENRTMLGEEQLRWLEVKLTQSKANWKLIGNQVIFSRINRPTGRLNLDAWDGYPIEQQRLGEFILENEIKNVVFLTGDTHASWALEVNHNPLGSYRADMGGLAVEFGTTSINSANLDERLPVDSAIRIERGLVDPKLNPHLKYNNMRNHGYLSISFTQEQMSADFIYVETVKKRDKSSYVAKSFLVNSGESKIIENH